jgi:hypothetical protein
MYLLDTDEVACGPSGTYALVAEAPLTLSRRRSAASRPPAGTTVSLPDEPLSHPLGNKRANFDRACPLLDLS